MKKCVKFFASALCAALLLSLSCGLPFSNSLAAFADEAESGDPFLDENGEGGEVGDIPASGDNGDMPDGGEGEENVPENPALVVLPAPAITGQLVYNGTEYNLLEILELDGASVEASGIVSATNAGVYQAQLVFAKEGYVWEDTLTSQTSIEWEIQKRTLAVSLEPLYYDYTGGVISPEISVKGYAERDAEDIASRIDILSGGDGTERGVYKMEISLSDRNYELSESTLWWLIKDKNESFMGWLTVTFDSNGGSDVGLQRVLQGQKLEKPEDPVRNGYTFGGWFKDSDFVTPFDFAHDEIWGSASLYAYWFENEVVPEDDLLTLMGCKSSVSASAALVGGTLVLGVAAVAIKKKRNKK